MSVITTPEQLGACGLDIRVNYQDGSLLSGHATMRADNDLVDLVLADGRVVRFSLQDADVREVTCLGSHDD